MGRPANAAPGNAGARYSSSEKRKSQRHACDLQAAWRKLGGADFNLKPATVTNISLHGAALRVADKCEPGGVIAFQIEGVSEQLAGPWMARAVNVRHQAGTWVIGCSFFRELTEEELAGILRPGDRPVPARAAVAPPPAGPAEKPAAPPPSGKGAERRAAPRRPGKRVTIIVTLPNANAKRCAGRVVDGSEGGLALQVPWAFSVGAIIKVRATNARMGDPWVPLRVKHRRRANHQWLIGCQFTEPVSAAFLATLC